MPRGSASTDRPYANLVLHLHTSMSGFKDGRIDGCFFRATYSGKGGAYDLTAHYSLLVQGNDRAKSPMRFVFGAWHMDPDAKWLLAMQSSFQHFFTLLTYINNFPAA